jgi:hypothetical protein
MAHCVFDTGLQKSMPAFAGYKLWKALHNISFLKPEDQQKARAVKAIYLNWHTAPEDYIQENLSWIIPMALNDWAVDLRGRPVKPSTEEAWAFAKRWGLWEYGKPTDLVTIGPAVPTQTALADYFRIND